MKQNAPWTLQTCLSETPRPTIFIPLAANIVAGGFFKKLPTAAGKCVASWSVTTSSAPYLQASQKQFHIENEQAAAVYSYHNFMLIGGKGSNAPPKRAQVGRDALIATKKRILGVWCGVSLLRTSFALKILSAAAPPLSCWLRKGSSSDTTSLTQRRAETCHPQ